MLSNETQVDGAAEDIQESAEAAFAAPSLGPSPHDKKKSWAASDASSPLSLAYAVEKVVKR